MAERDRRDLPIGIFDSGMGGLTVLSALMNRLPHERFCYLGDTARLPYGTKSSNTIVRYSLQVAQKLVERDIKLLVIACNTATAAALPHLEQAHPRLPVVGVVEPGARAACRVSPGGNIVVLATESTIRDQAYTRAIKALRPDANVTGIACTLFVPLAEEGWMTGPVAEAIAARYLEPLMHGKDRQTDTKQERNPDNEYTPPSRPDCLVLGCTHYPPLAPVIRSVVGDGILLIDSAATTAEAVEDRLRQLDMLRPPQPTGNSASPGNDFRPQVHFLTTDAPERFARVGGLFLGRPLDPESLELVVL